MARTFCKTPLDPREHQVRTERGFYRMSAFWIDTTSPCDMMDFDHTQSISEAIAAANETHRLWCKMQAAQ